MPVTQLFDESWFTGTAAVATDVPWAWDCALDGHGFIIDWLHVQFVGQREGSYTSTSVPVNRTQADTSNEPGEQTLNPNAPWRRAIESWHAGAGQSWQDRPDSNRARFLSSKGVFPWTQNQLSLLNGTHRIASGSSTVQLLAGSDDLLWRADGHTVSYSTDGTTWTTISGTPNVDVASIASDGSRVYVLFSNGDVWTGTTTLTLWVQGNVVTATPSTVRATTQVFNPVGTVHVSGSALAQPATVNATTSFGTLTPGGTQTPTVADLVRYANGRLLIGSGPNLYNPPTGGQLPEPLFTHDSPDWRWVDACPGPKFIYVAGRSGSTSAVYKIPLRADASGLDIPVVAGTLEPGEIVYSVGNNQGNIVVGTARGARYAAADANGDLVFGELIPTTSPVRCVTTWDRFVFAGCTNYDTTSTGLLRLDPLTFTSDLTPAYATDLMATAQGDVTSVVFFNSLCYFTVASSGVWADNGAPVASGTITSGRVGYNLPDIKNLLSIDLLHAPLSGSIAVTLIPDDGTPVALGESNSAGTVAPEMALSASQRPCRWFTTTLTLTPGTTSPVLHRVTSLAWPAPHRVLELNVPLLIQEDLSKHGVQEPFDCALAEQVITEMLESGRYVPFQTGAGVAQVFVTDMSFIRRSPTTDGAGYQGTLVVDLMGL